MVMRLKKLYHYSSAINNDVDYLLRVKCKRSYLTLKRLMDITGALFGIIILSPLFIITALLIKFDSPGPIFFIQKRCGKDGKIFNMYKFRSMHIDSEKKISHLNHLNEVKGLMFKIKNDPRVTKLGSFIRKTSIDELPQLINVFKGEMSLVGPRPPLVNEVEKYDTWHKLRLKIKPGMTGLWQINGRSDVGFYTMVMLDLKYITKCNIWYDILIVLKTIPIVINSYGAY